MSLFKTFWLIGFLFASCAFAKEGTLSGTGTSADPWLIEDYADLKMIGSGSYQLDDSYEQMADIDASASASENSGAGFVPIGKSAARFLGRYNGKGHVIKGLNINRPQTSYVGLFGYVGSNGVIDSLGLVGGAVNGSDKVGGIVGYNYYGTVRACYSTGSVTGSLFVGGVIGDQNTGTVTGCYSTASVTSSSNYVGGVVGRNYSGTMKACYFRGDVKGASYVGGVVGENDAGTVSNCFSTGTVIGTSDWVGGVVGENNSGTVSNCFSTGSITGDDGVGGLMGANTGINSGYVSGSHSTGSVKGDSLVGGLVGYNYNGKVSYSYSTGLVVGFSSVGGLVGDNEGTVNGCYSTSFVTGTSHYVGGFVGFNGANCTVSASYWNTETSGLSIGIGADNFNQKPIGYTTAKMQNLKNFTGWDFSLSWEILEGQSYPGYRSVDDAPFAFADTLYSTKIFDLKRLLINDYDIETSQANLILHVDSLSAGTTDSTESVSFPKDAAVGDTLHIVYRVGEIRSTKGDTLWGNRAKSIVMPIVILSFELASNSKTYGDTAFDLNATCTDESGVSLGGITFTSSDETLATINGSTVTILGAGEVTLIATSKFAANDINQTLTVAKAPLTVTAKAETITLGETPKLAYSITSGKLFGTDKLTGALSANKTTVGKNDILQGTLSAGDNYVITYVPATLTVKAAATSLLNQSLMPVIDLGRLQGYDLNGRRAK